MSACSNALLRSLLVAQNGSERGFRREKRGQVHLIPFWAVGWPATRSDADLPPGHGFDLLLEALVAPSTLLLGVQAKIVEALSSMCSWTGAR